MNKTKKQKSASITSSLTDIYGSVTTTSVYVKKGHIVVDTKTITNFGLTVVDFKQAPLATLGLREVDTIDGSHIITKEFVFKAEDIASSKKNDWSLSEGFKNTVTPKRKYKKKKVKTAEELLNTAWAEGDKPKRKYTKKKKEQTAGEIMNELT